MVCGGRRNLRTKSMTPEIDAATHDRSIDNNHDAPRTDHWGNVVVHYDDEDVCGAGESRQCQSCEARFEVALIAPTADSSSSQWEEFYECQNCGATGSFRFDGRCEDARQRRTWTEMIAYAEDV